MPKREQKKFEDTSQNGINELSLRSVGIFHIDMNSSAIPGIAKDENEQLVNGLRQLGLYDSKYAYSVVAPHLLEQLLSTGTYRYNSKGVPRESIYCLVTDENQVGDDSLVDSENGFEWQDYVNFDNAELGIPLAIYDRRLLKNGSDNTVSKFRFACANKIDALVAVVILDNY